MNSYFLWLGWAILFAGFVPFIACRFSPRLVKRFQQGRPNEALSYLSLREFNNVSFAMTANGCLMILLYQFGNPEYELWLILGIALLMAYPSYMMYWVGEKRKQSAKSNNPES